MKAACSVLLLLLLPACVPSNVVAAGERAVVLQADAVPWHAATAADLPGLWASSSIEGPVAASLVKVLYWLSADGQLTGAALLPTEPPRFEVLSGRWTLEGDRLTLGEGEPAVVEAYAGWLRLRGSDGVVVLVREEAR